MSKPNQLSPFGHALAGALGGVFSNAVVYPLDTVKTRIQAAPAQHGRKQRQVSILSVLMRIIKEEGIAGYYGGFFASMLNTFSQQYAYFFVYSFVRTSYIKRLAAKSKSVQLSTAAELILGAIAGALAQIFTIPVSVIATRQQVGRSVAWTEEEGDQSTADSKKSKEPYDDSFLAVARDIIRQDGVSGLWLGLSTSLVLTVNPSITYGVYERIKSIILSDPQQKLSPWGAFALGASSKTLATIVTYPYIMAKTRIQTRSARSQASLPLSPGSPPSKPQHAGAIDILVNVLRSEGITGWYQGMSAQITKAVLSQALLFMSKEQFETLALSLVLITARIRTKTVPGS